MPGVSSQEGSMGPGASGDCGQQDWLLAAFRARQGLQVLPSTSTVSAGGLSPSSTSAAASHHAGTSTLATSGGTPNTASTSRLPPRPHWLEQAMRARAAAGPLAPRLGASPTPGPKELPVAPVLHRVSPNPVLKRASPNPVVRGPSAAPGPRGTSPRPVRPLTPGYGSSTPGLWISSTPGLKSAPPGTPGTPGTVGTSTPVATAATPKADPCTPTASTRAIPGTPTYIHSAPTRRLAFPNSAKTIQVDRSGALLATRRPAEEGRVAVAVDHDTAEESNNSASGAEASVKKVVQRSTRKTEEMEKFEMKEETVKDKGEKVTAEEGEARVGARRGRRRRKAARDPLRPRRPKSAFILFCQARRPAVREELGTGRISQVQRRLSELWRGLPEEAKEQYRRQGAAASMAYRQAMASYTPSPQFAKAPHRQEEEDTEEEEEEEELEEEEVLHHLMFACSFCHLLTLTEGELREHMAAQHSGPQPQSCITIQEIRKRA